MLAEKAKVPLGRFARFGEIAEAICFLTSLMSSYMMGSYMSGSSLIVDGYIY